jgi:hypothetical protein
MHRKKKPSYKPPKDPFTGFGMRKTISELRRKDSDVDVDISADG